MVCFFLLVLFFSVFYAVLTAFHVLFSLFHAPFCISFFFFNDTATTEIYTLSLHDALPICARLGRRPLQKFSHGRGHGGVFRRETFRARNPPRKWCRLACAAPDETLLPSASRSEEHTSELQSPDHLVCLLLL